MYKAFLGFPNTSQQKKTFNRKKIMLCIKQKKNPMQQKIFYNLNPDVRKKNTSTMTTKKILLIINKKKNVSLRYVMVKKTHNKKNIAFSPAPPAIVMFCGVLYIQGVSKQRCNGAEYECIQYKNHALHTLIAFHIRSYILI